VRLWVLVFSGPICGNGLFLFIVFCSNLTGAIGFVVELKAFEKGEFDVGIVGWENGFEIGWSFFANGLEIGFGFELRNGFEIGFEFEIEFEFGFFWFELGFEFEFGLDLTIEA